MNRYFLALAVTAACQPLWAENGTRNFSALQSSFENRRIGKDSHNISFSYTHKKPQEQKMASIENINTGRTVAIGIGVGFVSGTLARELAVVGVPVLERSRWRDVPVFIFNRYTVLGALAGGAVALIFSLSMNSGIKAAKIRGRE